MSVDAREGGGNPESNKELGHHQHSMYPHIFEGTTDFLTSSSTSSPLCIRLQCCRKLSRRGQILSFLGQPVAAQRKLRSLAFFGAILCTLFLCRSRSFLVLNPSFRRQPGSSQRKGLVCRSWCFLVDLISSSKPTVSYHARTGTRRDSLIGGCGTLDMNKQTQEVPSVPPSEGKKHKGFRAGRVRHGLEDGANNARLDKLACHSHPR